MGVRGKSAEKRAGLSQEPAFAPSLLWMDGDAAVETLGKALEKKGWSLLRAGSEKEALALLASHPVDILIAGERGAKIGFLRKAGKRSPGTKKIVLTGRLDAETMVDYTNRAGVDFLLTQPVTQRGFNRALRQLYEELQNERAALSQPEGGGRVVPGLKAGIERLEAHRKERASQLSESNRELRKALHDIEEKNKALTVLNQSLKIQSTTDPLTGLYNRREFLNRIRMEWGRFKRHNRPLSLILLDIDLFKNVNDTYGHECGDAVLRTLGLLIRKNKRLHDLCCRYGGEEFVVLLTETTLDTAFHVAEGLRRLVGNHRFEHNKKRIRIHISAGVAGALEQNIPDVESFINQADKSMYRAKRMGRNRTVVTDPHDDTIILRQSRFGRPPAGNRPNEGA